MKSNLAIGFHLKVKVNQPNVELEVNNPNSPGSGKVQGINEA